MTPLIGILVALMNTPFHILFLACLMISLWEISRGGSHYNCKCILSHWSQKGHNSDTASQGMKIPLFLISIGNYSILLFANTIDQKFIVLIYISDDHWNQMSFIAHWRLCFFWLYLSFHLSLIFNSTLYVGVNNLLLNIYEQTFKNISVPSPSPHTYARSNPPRKLSTCTC